MGGHCAALVAVAVGFILDRSPAIAALAGRPPAQLGPAAAGLALAAIAYVAVAAIAVSVLELALRAARRRTALRMTVREARDEQRTTAGDPALRRRQREAGRGDARALVADAVVVLVGEDAAVAVGWRPGEEPRVLARGRGVIARALGAAARARHVPIAVAPELAANLASAGPVPRGEQPALASVLAALGLGPR